MHAQVGIVSMDPVRLNVIKPFSQAQSIKIIIRIIILKTALTAAAKKNMSAVLKHEFNEVRFFFLEMFSLDMYGI